MRALLTACLLIGACANTNPLPALMATYSAGAAAEFAYETGPGADPATILALKALDQQAFSALAKAQAEAAAGTPPSQAVADAGADAAVAALADYLNTHTLAP